MEKTIPQEMTQPKTVVLVRNKKTNQIYEWVKDDRYINLSTGKEGVIPDEKAGKSFVLPVQLNLICNKYPLVLELIEALQLHSDTPFIEP